MKKIHLIWIIPFCIVFGMFMTFTGEDFLMGEYDLYNCIYDNADDNGFSKNPYLIGKIQDECICFRENNYTNLIAADC